MKKESKSRFALENRKYTMIRAGIVSGCVLLVFLLLVIFLLSFKVTTVQVNGNVHYTSAQIEEMVLGENTFKNSLYLSMKYKNKGMEDIPFIEKIDITVVDRNTININVYEKSLAGYVTFLGNCMYFDKDGIVVENSSILTPGIPEVTGLHFDYVVLHEKLPVADEDVFQQILNMTNLLNKNGLNATKLQFDAYGNMTLYFNDVRIVLGDDENELKLMRIKEILPSLQGKSGVIRMDDYVVGDGTITFVSDEKEVETSSETEEFATEVTTESGSEESVQ
ncbi:MAG: cell division protein FtsQ [Lachnospiraceae bacterium]|nr:cell division protein FtsQ [Lachnospiraceae bacterium]